MFVFYTLCHTTRLHVHTADTTLACPVQTAYEMETASASQRDGDLSMVLLLPRARAHCPGKASYHQEADATVAI